MQIPYSLHFAGIQAQKLGKGPSKDDVCFMLQDHGIKNGDSLDCLVFTNDAQGRDKDKYIGWRSAGRRALEQMDDAREEDLSQRLELTRKVLQLAQERGAITPRQVKSFLAQAELHYGNALDDLQKKILARQTTAGTTIKKN